MWKGDLHSSKTDKQNEKETWGRPTKGSGIPTFMHNRLIDVAHIHV